MLVCKQWHQLILDDKLHECVRYISGISIRKFDAIFKKVLEYKTNQITEIVEEIFPNGACIGWTSRDAMPAYKIFINMLLVGVSITIIPVLTNDIKILIEERYNCRSHPQRYEFSINRNKFELHLNRYTAYTELTESLEKLICRLYDLQLL